MKRIVLQLSASIVFFANASSVFASATVSTLANASVSADTVGGAYTTLTGPQLDEAVNGDIHAPGTIVLRAPAGFIFDTTSTVTVTVSRLNASSSALLTLSNATAAVSSNAITVGVASADGSSGNPKPLARLVWSGIKVRPTAGTPLASGTITSSGTASIIGVSGTTSFGSLTERPGNAVSLTAGGYGLTRTAGQNGTLTVTAKDQFGNTATNYTGTVHISTTDSQATPPADYTFSAVDAGVHGFSFPMLTAGYQNATATDVNTTSLTASQLNILITAGSVSKLAFTTQPGGAAYKTVFINQPVVKTTDRYGNITTNGLGTSLVVTVSLTTGTGPLVGTTSYNIGTANGKGTVTFTNLQINKTENGDVLTAVATGLTNAVSSSFNVSPATLTVTATATNKVYNGTAIASVGLSDNRFSGDTLTVNYTAATFSDKNAANNKTVTVSGLSLSGASAGNYSLASTTATTTANITRAALTVSATGVNKTYDGSADAAVTLADNRIAGDSLTDSYTGASFTNKNVGTGKSITVSGISVTGTDAGNYSCNTTATATANISARTLTIGASANNKVYDGTTAATVTLSDNRISGDIFTDSFTTSTFTNRNVGTGKGVNVTGISISGADAGNYTFNTSASTTADITAVSVSGNITADNKAYDGTTDATIATRGLTGAVSGDDVSLSGGTAAFADKNVGTGKMVTATGLSLSGADAGNYTLSSTNASTTADITTRSLTVSATGQNKAYDGNADATVTLSDDRLEGDVFTANYTTASFSDKTVGTGKAVSVTGISVSGTDAGNYSANTTASTTANITAISVSGSITADNKSYDGNTTATIASRNVSGAVDGDDVSLSGGTATFADKDVGTGKTVSATGLSLTGADAGNYTLASSSASTTADITAVSVSGNITADNKAYDGTTAATIATRGLTGAVSGDDVSLSGGTATFADKNVGEGKTVSATGLSLSGADAGNYTLSSASASATADITARSLTVSATGQNKAYDGNADATVTLSDDRLSGDVFTASYTTASFSDKTVGTGKAVSVTGISVSGADAGNYSANTTASTTANITAISVSGSITADNKSYDGNTTATIASRNVSGAVDGDDVSLSGGTATFADKNVGEGKTVSATGLSLTGADAGNYTLASSSASTTADITARSLTVSATGQNKAYDGNADATVTLSDDRIIGDTFTANYTNAAFADKNVGAGKAVSVSGISISGTDANNYTANTTASTAADITAVSVSGNITADNKVYDGTTAATIATRGLTGAVGGDDVSLSGGTAVFADKNVGTGKTVTATGLSLGGTDAGNYTLSSTNASTTADITARSLTVGATGQNKAYDGNTDATVTLSNDRVSGDTVSADYTAASFADKNVGTGKIISVSGISISGADVDNYTLSSTTASASADITARSLTVTATGVNKVYDGSTTASVSLADDRLSGDSLTDDYTSASFEDKNVGTGKAVSVSGISISGTDAGNYSANSTASATADITAAALTITANDTNRVYGASNPAFTATYSGFVGDDDAGVLSGSPAFSTIADGSSSVAGGPYAITVTNGTLNAANYTLAFVDGQLTVTPASSSTAVSVSANPTPTGSNVTLTATLAAVAPGDGDPTGTVQFLIDGSAWASPATLTGGVANLATAALTHGNHSVTAEYAGDGNFYGSTNDLGANLLVNQAPAAGAYAVSANKNVAATILAAAVASAGTDPDGDALSVTAVDPTSAQGGTVVLSAGQIIYTPATNFAGADSFGYTLTDVYGATASGTVTVNVIGHGSQPANFVLLTTPPNHIEIRFNGTPGAEYWVQATTNLGSSWITISTNVPDISGVSVWEDTAAPNYPNRFYRAVAP